MKWRSVVAAAAPVASCATFYNMYGPARDQTEFHRHTATNFKIKKLCRPPCFVPFAEHDTMALCAVARDDVISVAQKVSLFTRIGSKVLFACSCSLSATNSQYHIATMISQRVIVLSALVALFALLSTADAQQQLRANNKRVLLEQEVSRVDIEPT